MKHLSAVTESRIPAPAQSTETEIIDSVFDGVVDVVEASGKDKSAL